MSNKNFRRHGHRVEGRLGKLAVRQDPLARPWAPGPRSRQCGPCTMCCTALPIAELKSPPGVPCEHLCATGCGVFEDRPHDVCGAFACNWLRGDGSSYQRPDRMGAMPVVAEDPNVLVLYLAEGVDPTTMSKQALNYVRRWLGNPRRAHVQVLWGDGYEVTTSLWADGREQTQKTPFIQTVRGEDDVDDDKDEDRGSAPASEREGGEVPPLSQDQGVGADAGEVRAGRPDPG